MLSYLFNFTRFTNGRSVACLNCWVKDSRKCQLKFFPKLAVSLRCRCWVDIKDANKTTSDKQSKNVGPPCLDRISLNVTVTAKNGDK